MTVSQWLAHLCKMDSLFKLCERGSIPIEARELDADAVSGMRLC